MPIRTINMGFVESEDRLLIDFLADQGIEPVFATRRITRRTISALAQILADSSPITAKVPSTQRSEVMIWEHLSALQPAGETPVTATAGAPDRPAPPWPLLRKLDVTALETGFALSFETDRGRKIALTMTRAELHRLLANLRQLARHAEWDLDAEVGWLIEADSPLMHRGTLAS